MRLSVRQGDRDIGRRCERRKVQRHQAEAVGFKADGEAGMGDRDGRIRVARGRHAKGDHRRIGGLGADIQAAGQAERAEFGGGIDVRNGGAGKRQGGRRVEGCGTNVRRSALGRDGRQGGNHGRVGEPGGFGQIDRIGLNERVRRFRRVLRLQNGGKGGRRLHARCGGRRAHAEGCGTPARGRFGAEVEARQYAGLRRVERHRTAHQGQRADAHNQLLLRHDDRTSAI
jgi:hypothetical protein